MIDPAFMLFAVPGSNTTGRAPGAVPTRNTPRVRAGEGAAAWVAAAGPGAGAGLAAAGVLVAAAAAAAAAGLAFSRMPEGVIVCAPGSRT
jgi:hypothetical protein